MLNELKTFGINEGYFEIKRIREFPNAAKQGISHINTLAIDFDKTTEILCGEHGQESFKSCDALDIVELKNRINLIEFKQLIDQPDIEKWIEDIELPQKIKESHVVLLNIIKKSKFIHKDKRRKFTDCEKNVIISFSLSGVASKRLAIVIRYSVIEEIILKQFRENYPQGENYNSPVCIRMAKFDTDYSKYV
ncbi:MAG: hypothetical protein WC556_06145 [Candidatus Methanoperedens sp.]